MHEFPFMVSSLGSFVISEFPPFMVSSEFHCGCKYSIYYYTVYCTQIVLVYEFLSARRRQVSFLDHSVRWEVSVPQKILCLIQILNFRMMWIRILNFRMMWIQILLFWVEKKTIAWAIITQKLTFFLVLLTYHEQLLLSLASVFLFEPYHSTVLSFGLFLRDPDPTFEFGSN